MWVPEYAVFYLKKGEFCMNQCLRITFVVPVGKREKLRAKIHKQARTLLLEGTVQVVRDTHIKVVACGSRENMEQFLDTLHHEIARQKCDTLEIEPFLKERDYRGVFRVIE